MQRKLIPGLVYDYVFQRMEEEWKENHERDKQWKEEMRLLFSDVDSLSFLVTSSKEARRRRKERVLSKVWAKRRKQRRHDTKRIWKKIKEVEEGAFSFHPWLLLTLDVRVKESVNITLLSLCGSSCKKKSWQQIKATSKTGNTKNQCKHWTEFRLLHP